MIKNILNVNGVKALTKAEQFSVLGGSVVRLVCRDGDAVSGDLPSCHCSNLGNGMYLVQFPEDGTGSYTTYNMLGRAVEEF